MGFFLSCLFGYISRSPMGEKRSIPILFCSKRGRNLAILLMHVGYIFARGSGDDGFFVVR